MKVAVLMLSYERYDTLKRVLDHNMANAGYPFDLFAYDNGSKDNRIVPLLRKYTEGKYTWNADRNNGIAFPLNLMAYTAFYFGYDAVHVMANDILEPDNWMGDKIRYLEAFPNTGMISICPGPISYAPMTSGGLTYYKGDVIGQFMITRQVWEKVGAFNEIFGLYGPIDNDYNARCSVMGFENYYIPGQSIHLGDDSPVYGYDKAQQVANTWPVHVENVKRYQRDPASTYIPVNGDHIINMNQYFNDQSTGTV